MGLLCTMFANSCESVFISKQEFLKRISESRTELLRIKNIMAEIKNSIKRLEGKVKQISQREQKDKDVVAKEHICTANGQRQQYGEG